MAHQEGSKFVESKDIPICSICDVVSLEQTYLPTCSHPVCPKCLAMANLHTSKITITCRTCTREEQQKATAESHMETTQQTLGFTRSGKLEKKAKKNHLQLSLNTAESLRKDEETITYIPDTKTEDINTAAWSLKQHDPNQKEQEDLPYKPQEETVEEAFEATQLDRVRSAEKFRRSSLPVISVSGLTKPRRSSLPSVIIVPGLMGLSLQEESNRTLAENVDKIREALSLATKHRHCATCLQAKKSTLPEVKCMDCDTSFCSKCSTEHKSIKAYSHHIMVPVERQRRSSVVSLGRAQGPLCLTHQGAELGMYCRNCEILLCRECVVDQHLDCPGVVSAQDYATEEREAVQLSRIQYTQVLRFFSEQRQEADDTMATLTVKKRNLQDEIRKYFSTLIKSCMDVEGALLEELEMCVTDHTDLLTQQSSAWLNLQECVHQLLNVTDVLHFLPTPDFLPLSVASKSSLTQALREGEMLAAEAPAHMFVNLSLNPSVQHSVVESVQEIGSTALMVTTHSTVILRKITSMPYSSSEDTGDPQITSMVLLTQTSLLAADFNNSSLKLFHREEKGEGWIQAEVLPLKWRPYAITQLLLPPETSKSEKVSLSTISEEPSNSSDVTTQAAEEGDENVQSSSGEQSADCSDEEEMQEPEATVTEVQVAVTSPSSGCFIINVPLTGEKKMEVVRAVSEEKGCWGVAAVDEKTLAAVTVESGQSYISMIDMGKNTRQHLPLDSTASSPLLQSPRHILAITTTSLVICDKSKRAVIQVSMDGTVLFTYTGHGNQQLLHPEDVCMDRYGYIYITDPEDNSVTVLNSRGTLYRKTSRQQNDLNCPYAACVDKNGYLYTANEGGKVLTVYDIIYAG